MNRNAYNTSKADEGLLKYIFLWFKRKKRKYLTISE